MNYYKIEMKGKNPRRFLLKILNQGINCRNIRYERKRIVFEVAYEDYEKIKGLNTIYEINILQMYGKEKWKSWLNTFLIFFISSGVGLLLIFVLSHIIFKIEVVHEKSEIRALVFEELRKENIKLYSLKKNYETLHKITQKIKENNKDKIEWIEIDSVGVTYQVRVIERIMKEKDENDEETTDIIAAKNGLIMDMYTESGEIKKNKGDYVKKGEVIISGIITRNENIVGMTKSKADVYAEVWYKVYCSSFLKQKIAEETNKSMQKLILKVGNKEMVLFAREVRKQDTVKKKLFQGIFSLLYYVVEPIQETKEKIFLEEELQQILEEQAKQKMESQLNENEKILMQKTLKTTVKDGKMNLEVFFKVYENIAMSQKTVVPEEEKKPKEVR